MPKTYTIEEKKDFQKRVGKIRKEYARLRIFSYTKQFPTIEPIKFRHVMNLNLLNFSVLEAIEKELLKYIAK